MDVKDLKVTESSGNVFADLGLPNPRERLAKAELARQIRTVITDRGLTQAQAGALLGIAQPNVSNLVRGNLARFSIEKMTQYLIALRQNVQIVVSPAANEEARGELTVAIAHGSSSGGAASQKSVGCNSGHPWARSQRKMP